MVSEGVFRIPLKFYDGLQYRFWENWCQINMGLHEDWYVFVILVPVIEGSHAITR